MPDHALGRAARAHSLSGLLYDAHNTLLCLPAKLLDTLPNMTDPLMPGVYIKAGKGCFVGHLLCGPGRDGEPEYTFRAKTWLPREMLHADQVILSEKAERGERLYDSYLRPKPMR